jgi:hypothetical protein
MHFGRGNVKGKSEAKLLKKKHGRADRIYTL